MIGTTISHYRILSPLGHGGMGVVYEAEDTRLRRRVALKFLADDLSADASAVERFQREARAASGLNHPNVCAIHDIGEHDGRQFIVMELLEGLALNELVARGPMPVQAVLDVGIQLADALAAAHAVGVIHRDVKPANVFVTGRGTAKLLDFGLATARGPDTGLSAGTAAGTTLELTGTGTILGTVAYMSPEQVRGEPLDARTDLFSLGAVLYEMATGRQAFAGATAGTIYDAILNREPVAPAALNPGIPSRLNDIITRALEKDRALRHQDATDLRADLQRLRRDLDSGRAESAAVPGPRPSAPWWRRPVWLGAGAVLVAVLTFAARFALAPSGDDAIDSVAVLPFANDTNDPDSEYLSDGITESVINSLSQLPSLRVAARSTVFRYKGQPTNPQQVGRELGVRAVLSGRLLQRDGRLIVRSELMDVSDGSHLWGGESSSTAENVFALQSQLSTEISERLRLRLTGEQRRRLAQPGTANNEAYRLYLRGRHEWHKLTPDSLARAITFLNQAVEKDPAYAQAYAGLADAYNLGSFFNVARPRDIMPKATAAASRALEIDPGLAEAHISLAYGSFTYEWDYDAATTHIERARALNPTALEHHRYYPFYLTVGGRHAEAVAAAERMFTRDPISASASHTLAVQLALAGRFDEAIRECERTIELDPGFDIAWQVLGATYAAKGQYREALPAMEKALAGNPHDPITLAHAGYVRARLGDREAALRIAGVLESASKERYVPALAIALVFTGLEDRDQAFAWLERAYEERSNRLAYLHVEPVWASLRPDPRFGTLLKRIGLAR